MDPFSTPWKHQKTLHSKKKKERKKEKEVQQFSVILRITFADLVNWLSVNGKCKTDSYSS